MNNLKTILSFLAIIFSQNALGQLTDDFSDGDFTNNPAWSGDISSFIVNPSMQLQLNAAAAGSAYLSTSNNSPSLDNTEWQFYIRLNFAPSASNNARVYLVSDQANLNSSLNGYYLQFGENFSNDAIELFRQTGTTSVSVARGTNGFISTAFIITVKITRNNSGLWSIYADPAAGNNFSLQATGSDNTHNSSQWFGVVCNYTVSNITNFYFDDFYAGPIIVDLTPPAVVSINVVSQNQIDVTFSEPVEQTTAETLLNYSVNNGIGNPSTASRDGFDFSIVHLTFSNNFQNGITNTLSVLNVQDLNGNTISTASTGQFTYVMPVTPSPFDVVINEIMADPDPQQGLPAHEYLELFNRSSNTFNLSNWTITVSSTTKTFGNILMTPGSYLLICTPAAAPELQAFGQTESIFTSISTLTNTGTSVLIRDNNGLLIDSVKYDIGWYRDTQKDDGGYSLERIDPDYVCPNSLNWIASNDPLGGTPGKTNSVRSVFIDDKPPRLSRAYLSAPDKVIAVFNKPMKTSDIINPANFSVDFSFGNPASINLLSSVKIELQFSASFQPAVVYTLSALSSVTDCPGILISKRTARFGIPDTCLFSDILINEILYRPDDGGAEFIEVYNRTDKIIDLSKLKIAEINLTNNTLLPANIISDEPFLIFSNEYLVLSKNPDAVVSSYFTPEPDQFIAVSSFPALNDDRDGIAIVNSLISVIDQFIYSNDFQFPLLNDDKGISLERISFNRPTQDSTNWHSASESVGFATPAYKNSQHNEVNDDGSEVSVSPELFSPDNDGIHDVVSIIFHFNEPGFIANLKIFDSRGREIIHLIKNQLLGPDGIFSWDGITSDKEKAGNGIYIIYLEVFNAAGKVKKFKKPVVVASRL